MGRELKRVPLDFDWPMGKVWKGYKNPYYRKCPDCDYGLTPTGEAFERLVHLFEVAATDSLERPDDFKPFERCIAVREGVPIMAKFAFSREMPTKRSKNRMYPHPWLTEAGIKDVGSDFHELVEGLTGERSDGGPLGYSGGTRWRLQKKILEAAGLPEKWGQCPTCDGEGDDPATREAAEAWEPTQPPVGDGWQLWETVSEGSPVSPVFATADELIDHMSQPKMSEYEGSTGYTRAGAEAFVRGPGWAPSAVNRGRGFETGVDACAEE
jgi:hypothetical protein